MTHKDYRIEIDSLGEVEVPSHALYGAQSVRASQNFYIIGQKVHPLMIKSLAYVKKACAQANYDLKELSKQVVELIFEACDEIIEGQHHQEFITDAIQGGAGTSINMNMNEVIANRCAQIVGRDLGRYDLVHPNDQVNRSQSTNDVIPTAGKITVLSLAPYLIDELRSLAKSLESKAQEFNKVMKVGRTHLQDAVIISMGRVIQSFATMIYRDIRRLEHALSEMHTINLGATAIGTEINAQEGYKEKARQHLSDFTGIEFNTAEDLVDGTKHIDSFVYVHGALKIIAGNLSRMCNDFRLMASGPKVGLNEIEIPQMQPGSSIMPGKVNPVIFEVVNQVCFQVLGNDLTVSKASEAGQMELNVFEPVLFYNLFQSFEILTNACHTLRMNGIEGLSVNEDVCHQYVINSMALGTSLIKDLGYMKVSELTKKALKTNRSLTDLIIEEDLIDLDELDEDLEIYFRD